MRIDPTDRGLERAMAAVHPDVKEALLQSHAALAALGIPHVVIGDLAVGAHGYFYATRRVDYLVPEASAFEGKVVITFKPGVPIRVGDVPIDYLVPEGPENVRQRMEECMARALASPAEMTYVPSDLLTYMKLKAGRAKDIGAVVELLKTGMDPDATRAFLRASADGVVLERFDRCVLKAAEEE